MSDAHWDKLNKEQKKIIKVARSDVEMRKATLNQAPILMYSDLCKKAKKNGATRTIAQMFKQSPQNIILLQDPTNMNSGHWFSVSCNPAKKEIYFFSTYGKRPDVEKVSWIPKTLLKFSDQDVNLFNDALKEYQKHGWTIYYNSYPYQKEDVETATCGIFTAAFLRSGMNPDDFADYTKGIIELGENPAIKYFNRYF